jgi:hypothetical protein
VTKGELLMLPGFLVVGGARCGTTYLFELLAQNHHLYLNHPRTNEPITKDTYFFSHTCYGKKTIDISDYAKCFANAQPGQIAGEVATSYDFFPWVPALISKYLDPKIRLIFLVRNPVQRAYAHYMLSLVRGKEFYSFEKALQEETNRLRDTSIDYLYNLHSYSYMARGFYMKNIENYLAYFPKEQIKVVASENFYLHPKDVYREVCEFLNVKAVPVDFRKDQNKMQLPQHLTYYRYLKFVKSFTSNKPALWHISALAKKMLLNTSKSIRAYPRLSTSVAEQLLMMYTNDIHKLSAFLDTNFSGLWNIN